MRETERYYTAEFALSGGYTPITLHVQEYFDGTRTVPVSKAPSVSAEFLYFTLSDDLYKLFITNLGKIKKPYECALKYGFRGYSRGGKNGVFLLRKHDSRLSAAVDSLVTKHPTAVCEDLDCDESFLPKLRKIKVVYHQPSGERVIGLMNDANGRAILLGFASY